jgi:hypothetical protein
MPGDLMPEPSSAVTTEESRVNRTALLRGVAVCALWLATWPLRHSSGEMRLALDVGLALAGWWAMLPGRRAGGKLFGEHGHWSSLVVALPIGFAIAAAAELWHLIRGGG